MAERRRFTLVYDPAIRDHLVAIATQHHAAIRRAIEEQLAHQPEVETRNRKPLQRPSAFGAVLTAVPDPEDSDELEWFVLAHTPRFRRLLESAERSIDETGGLTHDQVWETTAPAPTPNLARSQS